MAKKVIINILIFLISGLVPVDTSKSKREVLDNKTCDQKLQICFKKCITDVEESRSAFRKGLCKDECAYNLKTQFGCVLYFNSSYK